MDVHHRSNSKRNRKKLKRVCQCAGGQLGCELGCQHCGSLVVLEMGNTVLDFLRTLVEEVGTHCLHSTFVLWDFVFF